MGYCNTQNKYFEIHSSTMWSHTWIGIWLGWAIFCFWYISFWTRIVHKFIQSFYNMHIIEKTGIFLSENYTIKINNTPTATVAHQNATVNSWLRSLFFFFRNSATKRSQMAASNRWLLSERFHATETRVQVVYIHEYIGTTTKRSSHLLHLPRTRSYPLTPAHNQGTIILVSSILQSTTLHVHFSQLLTPSQLWMTVHLSLFITPARH